MEGNRQPSTQMPMLPRFTAERPVPIDRIPTAIDVCRATPGRKIVKAVSTGGSSVLFHIERGTDEDIAAVQERWGDDFSINIVGE